MRCLLCGNWTFYTFCKNCFNAIHITPRYREIKGFKIYSFFAFGEIEYLLHAKYQVIGSKVYGILAKKASQYLKNTLEIPLNAYAVGIDDKISTQGYAHNAILLYHLKQVGLTPLYQTLYAKNPVSYAGKSLKFRQANPRNFCLKRKVRGKEIVLVDDIVTTGLTLMEAKECLESNGGKVLNAFVLADARN
ncbi:MULTISPECIES: phosphoribosyltransferase family protein [Helicobacter]|uniref:Transformation system protein n=1 Tax=Helicobacter ganmani TaxID=60246 RepID=A0A3D8IFL2_9HELI|nr:MULTISPECIES: phosphoribosyltransferase family protein [Helicobacter]RDU63900.1 transformation system protein [Helicobacter ganmani]